MTGRHSRKSSTCVPSLPLLQLLQDARKCVKLQDMISDRSHTHTHTRTLSRMASHVVISGAAVAAPCLQTRAGTGVAMNHSTCKQLLILQIG